MRIENIIDAPNFVEKTDAPLLQLADACAWVTQRWARDLPYGKECMHAMVGAIQMDWIDQDPVWETGANGALLNAQDYWDDADLRRDYYRDLAALENAKHTR